MSIEKKGTAALTAGLLTASVKMSAHKAMNTTSMSKATKSRA